ncbi:MAG: DUF6165 family protein, partial [Cyanobacteria bacterium MAG IRC3_bin_20]|nr:DUF6165 family protein [Cyanobacteria bacterium MAG IRC3_bin_20]
QAQGDLQAAIDAYHQALTVKPNYIEALTNLGTALREQGDLQAAIDAHRQALTVKPNYIEALTNLGIALQAQGDLQAAIDAYRQALAIKPDFPGARLNLSLIQLLTGDYESGWQGYDWRLSVSSNKILITHPQVERWDGHNLAPGEPLMLVAEQGLGDTLQFMRYVPYLNRTGKTTSLCAPTKLHGLIQSSGITTMIYSPEEGSRITQGKWLPLLSLPKYLNVSPANPLVEPPYIKAPQQNVEHWQQKLATEKSPIIGINWQGSQAGSKLGKTLPLAAFAPVIEQTDASLLSLQKGDGAEQLEDCPFRHRFVGCQEEINETWDFVETAAMIANCDLVITCDTSVAHLAAGMGKPTWVLLVAVPDWRWGMEGDTTFWYPAMRLFRQRERGNWQEVMDRVATALAAGATPWTETPVPGQKVGSMRIPVAFAELIDKITILEIKSEQLKGQGKVNVDHELGLLRRVLEQSGVELLPEHYHQLKDVNQSLWNIEDDIRAHEHRQDFGEQFIQLARSVYQQNDQRAAIKRSINDHYGSAIREEKSYS